MDTPRDLITTTEARQFLGISTHKMKDLIADGEIKAYTNKLDKRVKWVSRSEVEKLRDTFEEAA